MPTSKQRADRYQRSLEEALSQARKLDAAAVRTLRKRLLDLRGEIQKALVDEKLSDWGTKMAVTHYRRTVARIDALLDEFAGIWTQDATAFLEQILTQARMSVVDPLNASGYLRFRLRSTLADMTLLYEKLPTRITNITTAAADEIARRLRAEMMGTESAASFTDWLEDFLSMQPTRRTSRLGPLPYQAERLWRTEAMHTLNNGQRLALAELDREAPAWVKDHMRKWWKHGLVGREHPREAHVRTESRTRSNPIRLDEQFSINGHKCDGPHDPSLPASEVIFCGCTLITTVVGV